MTGALGLVGSAVIDELVDEGCRVVATDLENPSNRKKARRLQRSHRVEIRWADLTEFGAVDALVTSVTPAAIVHLAAVIPPLCYARRNLARAVNVDATFSLVRAVVPSVPATPVRPGLERRRLRPPQSAPPERPHDGDHPGRALRPLRSPQG